METPTTSRNRDRFLDREADVMEPGRNHAIDEVDRSSIPVTTCFELQEDPSFWKDNSVQVVIRIRPLNSSEISVQGHKRCVRQDTCQSITWMGHPESRFTFDHVADEHVSQEKLFKVAGVPMVENCVEGYNSCMFAYGQTGSGKTHTMLGDIEGGTRRNSVNAGITPRVFEYLFLRIQREKESRREEKLRFTCKCSFLEIYNEQILDLLEPSSSNLQIREDLRKGVYVENLAEVEVTNARDVIQLLVQGSTNRKVASTNMNSASSRSHCVFTCIIESKWELQGVTHHRFARLNLVDLAGSERQKSSGAEGERLKEATNINKSLSTLGLVIMNLVSNANKKSLHIPYRDSKLTFLLQDSLGGNSKTIIIANISPSNCNSLETLSTLKFAQRAKFIRNNAIVNEDASGDVIAMRMQIQQLKKEVNRLQSLVGGGITELSGNFSVGFPSSPGSFLLDSDHGSFSSLSFDKRFSQGMESEAALVASLKREQDKDNRIKALAAGKQVAEQLANQKIEEIKGLKMRLRFREERIKNLESRSSEKNLDVHHQQEKENLLKEIEILRNQIDRNPEITRFAMENLHLKEELRRMQSLVVESQQERANEMTEEITILRDKLLEALDWKMMHEKDVNAVQDLSTSWEDNEFLRLQAIQYERNWAVCLESKQKLERRVEELESQVEEIKAAKAANKDSDTEVTRATVPTNDVSPDDQIELKTMVEAISAASQREAEAHETAIILAKENEELHEKIRILVEEKNKVVEFYENARVEESYKPGYDEPCVNGQKIKQSQDSELLENELHGMPEHNKKLVSLYEQAIGERDELKRLLCSNLQQTTLKVSENFQSFGLLREAFVEFQELTSKIKFVDHEIQMKQQGISSIKLCSSEIQQRKSVLGNKLSALKYVFRTFSSNPTLQYLVDREMQAKARVNANMRSVQEMKEELVKLHSCKNECDVAYSKSVRSEAQLKEKINSINQELKNAENKKKETQKVLFTIDNFEKTDVTLHRSLHSGKVSELLKSEEEQAKLAAEKKKLRDSMTLLQKEITSKKKLAEKLDIRIQNMESELRSESASLGEEELHLLRIIDETATISQISDARREVEILLVDYQEIIFKLLLNEAEGQLFVEELEQQKQELDQLKCAHGLASGRLKQLMEESGGNFATLMLSMD